MAIGLPIDNALLKGLAMPIVIFMFYSHALLHNVYAHILIDTLLYSLHDS